MPPSDRRRAPWSFVTVVAVAAALVARVTPLASRAARWLGGLAATLLALRVVVAVVRAARGEMPWTRLPLLLVVAAEGSLVALRVPQDRVVARACVALVEVGAIAYALVVLARARRSATDAPLDDRLEGALGRVLPPALARVLVVEIAILRALVTRVRAPATDSAFAYTAESALKLVVVAYPLLLVGDLFAVHALVPARYVAAHVALTAIALYGFVWLLGLHRTMRLRPHRLVGAVLHVHRGALASAAIPLDRVESATPIDAAATLPDRPARLDVRGAPRVLVRLREPIACRGFLSTREARSVVVSADDPAALCAAIRGDRRPPASRRAVTADGVMA